MTTELTRCSNSKRSTTDSTNIPSITDQAKARLSPSPTTGKEFFRFPQRQRRKSSEKDEIGEKSVENRTSTCASSSTSASASASTSPPTAAHRKPSADAVISKRLKRAFSVHHQDSEDETKSPSSPKQKGTKKNELKKFGLIQLPNPNTAADFFKQRASFHSDTSGSCAAAAASSAASTSGLGEQATGIICSNSDLRSILTTTATGRRPGDVKRERMKNYRSLSFDSSVFRIPRKGSSSAETPVWFSWNNKSGARVQETGEGKQAEERKNVIQIRLTSESPEDDVLDSCSSGSENSPKMSSKVQVVIEDVKETAGIPWDERSVVDVNVLGNAIESYLGERRASGDEAVGGVGVKAGEESIQDVSLCSSLKSMFVK